MHNDYKELYNAAKAAGACPAALVWMARQEKPVSELTDEEVNHVTIEGYLNWVAEELPQFKGLVTPTPEQYERGLIDEARRVRRAWAWRKDLAPSAEQYERGLTDEDCIVRLSWAYRKDLTPNPEQYERGLRDADDGIREAWAEREDLEHLKTKELYNAAKEAGACKGAVKWMEQQEKPISELTQEEINYVASVGYRNWAGAKPPAFKALVTPTPEQYERGLTDENAGVRQAWAWWEALTPTPEQYERGLTDENLYVRWEWAERTDITPTPEQYERGLTDENSGVRTMWAKRTDIKPTAEQYERGLTDEDWGVCKEWAGRKGLNQLTQKNINNKINKFSAYERTAMQTCAGTEFKSAPPELMHSAVGICTEAGELMDAIKQYSVYGKELDVINLKEEYGDLLWYIVLGCKYLGCTLQEIMQMNSNKLKARYPNLFNKQDAVTRNLVEERKKLELS